MLASSVFPYENPVLTDTNVNLFKERMTHETS